MTHPWMNTYWTGERVALYKANAREIPLPDKSVHCVVTSPPYWGLRDYGLGKWEGGNAECGHERPESVADQQYQVTHPTSGGWCQNKGEMPPMSTCHCGAVQQAAGIGLEPTLGEWVQNIVAVMREVRRVLRDDGTVWLNLGDSYSSSNGQGRGTQSVEGGVMHKEERQSVAGIPPKNLMGQPWRAAFALQDDGWILRSAICWHKPNPMPESTRDRPTSAYEMIFLLSKQKRYFYDREAVREIGPSNGRVVQPYQKGAKNIGHENRRTAGLASEMVVNGANARNVWQIPTQGRPDAHFATFPDRLAQRCILAGTSEKGVCGKCSAPWRRKGASNNPELVAQSLKAYMTAKSLSRSDLATQVGIYPGNFWNWEHGGTPTVDMWQKVSDALDIGLSWEDFSEQAEYINETKNSDLVEDTHVKRFSTRSLKVTQTTGWQPTCGHNSAPVPAIVLDPFVGSGTTVAVAQSLGRCGIGLDLNAEYLDIAVKRITSGKYDWTPEGGKP